MAIALDAVSAGVRVALNVAALTALAPGGVSDDPAQGVVFPFVWFEVRERDLRGFGTGALPEIDVRVHAFSTVSVQEAQQVASKVVDLLKDQALTVAGWTQAGKVFYDDTLTFPTEVLNGFKVREAVSSFRVYVEA